MSDQAIIEKIAKMRRLAEKAGTPAEAANALAMAQRLMHDHGIAEAMLSMARGDDKLSGFGHQPIPINNAQWRQNLLYALVKTHQCEAVKNTYPSQFYDIIGHKDNVAYIIDTFEWLTHLLEIISEIKFLEYVGPGHVAAGVKKTWRTAFFYGAVSEIRGRLYQEMNENLARARAESAEKSTALIVIDERVKALVVQLYPHTHRTHSSQTVRRGSDGYAAGQRVGREVGLRRPTGIDGNPTRRLT